MSICVDHGISTKAIEYSPEENPDTIYKMANYDLLVVCNSLHGESKIQDLLERLSVGECWRAHAACTSFQR